MDQNRFDWIIIGAGPAGIAAVGKLLDVKIKAAKIGWIDPEFQAGDLGKKWHQVPANTRVEMFREFFHSCQSFQWDECKEAFPITSYPDHSHCLLADVSSVLKWITSRLPVLKFQTKVLNLQFRNSVWEIDTEKGPLFTKNAILCTGAEPNFFPSSLKPIPLEIALNPEELKREIAPDDVIAVFGASHSAILSLANILKVSQNNVFHFFRRPHFYATHPYENGLRGSTAEWARKYLDGNLPLSLKQFPIDDLNFSKQLAQCNRVIYAIGFTPRKILSIQDQYEKSTGMIGYGLYGLGIGFPLTRFNPSNQKYFPITLQSFVSELDLLLPLWLAYSNRGSYPEFPWLQ